MPLSSAETAQIETFTDWNWQQVSSVSCKVDKDIPSKKDVVLVLIRAREGAEPAHLVNH